MPDIPLPGFNFQLLRGLGREVTVVLVGIEADVDANGYDMQGEKAVFWAYLRLSLERGGPGESEKGEDIDLNGFGISVWTAEE